MVTTIKFRRPLQTNEPINDMAIPTEGFVSVIGAIGPLNSRREANAHSHDGMSVNSDDIRIDFSSKVHHIDHIDHYQTHLGYYHCSFLFSIDGPRLQIFIGFNTR